MERRIYGTDEMHEAVQKAASIIADEFFKQNGMSGIAEDHDESWYELQENIMWAMFASANKIIDETQFEI